MEKKQAEWIWEYLLKHCSNLRIIKPLLQAFPLPVDNVRIKKMVLLQTLSFELSKGLISGLSLELLQELDEPSNSEQQTRDKCLEQGSSAEVRQANGVGILGQAGRKDTENGKIRVLRRELDLALKVELTVRHLREGDKGWPSFVEALDKYWGDSAESEAEEHQHDEVTSAQKQAKLELWAIKARPKLQNEVIFKYSQDDVMKKLKAFLDIAWAEIGLTFLEKVEEDVLRGVYRPAGGVELSRCTSDQLQKEDTYSKEKLKARILHEECLFEDEEVQAVMEEGNTTVQTRSHTKHLRQSPTNTLKAHVATLLDSTTTKRLFQGSLEDGNIEKGFDEDKQDEYKMRLKLKRHKENRYEPKDGETDKDLKDSRSTQEGKALQEEGTHQEAQGKVAFHGIDDCNQRIHEVREDPAHQFNPAFLVKIGNKSKNISRQSKSLLSSLEADEGMRQNKDGFGEGTPAKGPSPKGDALEKHQISHKGTTAVDHFVTFSTEDGQGLDNVNISNRHDELEDNQPQFQSSFKNPLPAETRIGEEAKVLFEKDVHLFSGVGTRRAVRLQERKAVSLHTVLENKDENEDDQTESSPSDSKEVHLPELRARIISPLKTSASSPNQAFRRKRRKWSKLQEETLRTAVTRHGIGRWKLILQEHMDIFQDRTRVDLKDKWRNIEKSEGLSEDD